MDTSLRDELEAMLEADQALRKEAMAVAKEHGLESPAYDALRTRGRAEQERATTRLAEIFEEHGWPGRSLVGEEASRGAFFVLQHASPEVQERYAPLLRQATAAGEVDRTLLPLLEDRLLLHRGEKQRYGTQVTRGKDGKATLWPIGDAEHVDERRASAGLEPLRDYLGRFGIDPDAS